MRLTPDNILGYLAEIQLPFDATTLKHATVQPASGRNNNFAVDIPRYGRCLIKQASVNGSDAPFAGNMSVEACINTILSPNTVHEASSVALFQEPLFFDSDNRVIGYRYIDGESLAEYADRTLTLPLSAAQEIGRAIAAFHTDGRYRLDDHRVIREMLDSRAPHLLSFKFTLNELAWLPGEGSELIRMIQKYPSLAQALNQMRARWLPVCPIHGDLKLDNIILGETGKLQIIDWESSCMGPPEYDLGTLVGSYLDYWLESVDFAAQTEPEEWFLNAKLPFGRITEWFSHFWESYVAGLSAQPRNLAAMQLDLLRYVGVYFIDRAFVFLQTHGVLSVRAIARVQIGKNLVVSPHSIRGVVFDS